ncbi:hypothetical protein [Vibrio alginolyticus]|uniref:hypothetical protein n=1 Tax=Vibrio alginolyticus TaxID=663 RepID=UPI001C3D2C24|nr:hypothetical protein [Vibrio alginolyticus]UYE96224.1 hypothetical protein [Vibrio phage 31Fb.4]UYE96385.1 hypothetical protein [Vibrio phage 33Fb.4]
MISRERLPLVKRTSVHWAQLTGIVVMDPDGWDRQNFEYSWYEETITILEFWDRVYNSTTLMKLEN